LQLVTEVLPTVLLVDDTEEDAILFKRAYKGASIPNPLRVVHDGDDAIAYLGGTGKFANRDEHPLPQLVLLDLKMPGKSGFDVLRWMRSEPTTKELRVIVMTGSEDTAAVNRAYKMGANSFVVKSPTHGELVKQLREVKNHWL
jgi:CheY-like chemotaxis protein